MTPEQAEKNFNDLIKSFLDKGDLLLSVSVETPEQVEEIINWMYTNEKPMKASLNSISWDQIPVSKDVYEHLVKLKQEIQDNL